MCRGNWYDTLNLDKWIKSFESFHQNTKFFIDV